MVIPRAGEDLVVVERMVAPKSRQEVIDYYFRCVLLVLRLKSPCIASLLSLLCVRRYLFPAQELQHAVDKLTGKRYREARSVTLKKRKTESAPYSVQLKSEERRVGKACVSTCTSR